MSKTISFFGKADSRFARLAGHILVTVQNDLRGERGMSADFDRNMAPVRIEDMKRVVVHVRHRPLPLEVMFAGDLPYRRLGATYEN